MALKNTGILPHQYMASQLKRSQLGKKNLIKGNIFTECPKSN